MRSSVASQHRHDPYSHTCPIGRRAHAQHPAVLTHVHEPPVTPQSGRSEHPPARATAPPRRRTAVHGAAHHPPTARGSTMRRRTRMVAPAASAAIAGTIGLLTTASAQASTAAPWSAASRPQSHRAATSTSPPGNCRSRRAPRAPPPPPPRSPRLERIPGLVLLHRQFRYGCEYSLPTITARRLHPTGHRSNFPMQCRSIYSKIDFISRSQISHPPE